MLTDEEIDRHLDENPADDTSLVKRLRSELRDAQKAAKRVPDLEAKLAEKDFGDVLTEAKLNLNARQRAALRREVGDDTSVANVQAAAEELFGIAAPGDETVVPADEQAALDRQAATAQGAQPPHSSGVIKPEDAAAWPVDKTVRFMKAHPDAFEQLKRGDPVAGIAGW